MEFPYYVAENLEQIFRGKLKADLGSAEIMTLFNSFFCLEKSGTKGAVRYLLKSIEKKPIDTTDPELYKSYLLTILANNERSLNKACSLLINNKASLILNPSDIALVDRLLSSRLSNEHDLEVIWLLYLLIQTGNVDKGDAVASSVAHSHNELAQLLLLRKALLSEESFLHICTEATSWILLYELFAAGNISERDFV